MITLSNDQLQTLFNNKAEALNGMNEILTITLNAIMHGERTAYLQENKEPSNKANGYRPVKVRGYGRQLALAIPRDRLGTFKPILMLTLKEEEEELKNLCFELYREGLTTRRISSMLEKIYGKKYSKSSVSLMSQSFKESMEAWRNRRLEQKYLVVYLDALQAKVRRENVQGEAFYVALAVKEDYTREVIAIENQPTESASGWKELLCNLKERGLEDIELVVADGISGLEDTVLSIFPKASFQKCVTHFKRNVLHKVRPKDKALVAAELASIFDIGDHTYKKSVAYARATHVASKWSSKYPFLKTKLDKNNLRCYLTCLDFDFKVRSMLYTTNWIERLNKTFRRGLKIRNSMPSVDSVLLLLSAIAYDTGQKTYSYPVHNLKKEPKFQPKMNLSE
jgi:transposase-like protein